MTPRLSALVCLLGCALGALPAAANPAFAPKGPKPLTPQLPGLGTLPKVPASAFGNVNVEASPQEIVQRNLEAAAALYSASVLEEMSAIRAADRLADMFQSGQLALGAGGRDAALRYLKAKDTRLSETERRQVYAHVLGGTPLTTTASSVSPNQEFTSLFTHFRRAALDYDEQRAKAKQTQTTPNPTKLHASARALAQNLSNRSYGAALFSASMVSAHLRDAIALLSHPDVLAAHQAKDAWGVVQKVAKQQLGKNVDTTRLRTQASAGAKLIQWLGKVSQPLSSSGGAPAAAASAVADRVPETVRDLDRVLTAKQKLLIAQPLPSALQVQALCFDKQRKLVTCVVKDKSKAKK